MHGRGRRRLLYAGKSQKFVYCVLFLVSTIQDFCKFLFRRVRFLRMSHRFSQNGLDSSIPSCLISTEHFSDFEYTLELIFHMGSRDRDFSQISVSICIYLYIFTESYEFFSVTHNPTKVRLRREKPSILPYQNALFPGTRGLGFYPPPSYRHVGKLGGDKTYGYGLIRASPPLRLPPPLFSTNR